MVFIAELFWWFENVKPDFVQPRDVQELKDGEWQAFWEEMVVLSELPGTATGRRPSQGSAFLHKAVFNCFLLGTRSPGRPSSLPCAAALWPAVVTARAFPLWACACPQHQNPSIFGEALLGLLVSLPGGGCTALLSPTRKEKHLLTVI